MVSGCFPGRVRLAGGACSGHGTGDPVAVGGAAGIGGGQRIGRVTDKMPRFRIPFGGPPVRFEFGFEKLQVGMRIVYR